MGPGMYEASTMEGGLKQWKRASVSKAEKEQDKEGLRGDGARRDVHVQKGKRNPLVEGESTRLVSGNLDEVYHQEKKQFRGQIEPREE